jgi:DNA-directed RNA polymerase specialized sigma24 family protein
MTPPDSSNDRTGARGRLLAHADSLYAVAHALTMNAVQASALVESTYRRARSMEVPAGIDERLWLLRLLREEAGMMESSDLLLKGGSTPGDFRRQLAERAARRVLPVAFSSLSVSEREILILHYVERFELESIALVTGHSPDVVEARVAVADAALRTAVLNELAPGERGLLGEIPDGWIREAINEMAVNEIPVLPPTLRPSLERPMPGAGVQSAPPPKRAERTDVSVSKRLQRSLAVASIVFFTGLLGYVASRVLETPPDTSVITISARASDRARVELASDDPSEIGAYLEERTGWRLSVPEIDGAHLVGARITEPSAGIRVPTMVYADAVDGRRVVVLAYSYALIDRHSDELRFDRETLMQIQEEGRYDLHDLGGKQVLVWRHRNAIFVAVTEGQAEALHDRVYRSS